MIHGGTSSRARIAALLFIATALVAAACSSSTTTDSSGAPGSSPPGTGAGATTGGTGPAGTEGAGEAAFAGQGPYIAGTTRLDMDGRAVEVWYPASPSSATGAAKRIFEIRD